MQNVIQRLSIGRKLMLAFGAILVVVLALGAVTLARLGAIDANGEALRDHWFPSTMREAQLVAALSDLRRGHMQVALMRGQDRSPAYADIADATDRIAALQKSAASGADAAFWRKFASDYAVYVHDVDETMAQARAGANTAVFQLVASSRPDFDVVRTEALDELTRDGAAGAKAARADAVLSASTRPIIVTGIGLALVLCVVVWFWLARDVGAAIQGMTAAMRALADGAHGVAIPGDGRGDEIGAMARAVAVFRDGMERNASLSAEQARQAEALATRGAALDRLIAGFEVDAGEVAGALSSASTQLEETARGLSGSADDAARQAATAGAAAGQSSAGVQTVAAATEQLTASIGEITRQVNGQASTTRAAAEAASATDARCATWRTARGASARWSS